MNNGRFIYSKAGSDEVLGEATVASGFYMLARIALSRGGVRFPSDASVGVLAGLIAGEEAGVEGVSAGDLSAVDEEAVARAMCKIDIDIETDGADAESEGEGVTVDENPTATSGASC